MMNRTILAFLTCVSLAVSSGVHAASFKLGDVDMTLGGSARLDVGGSRPTTATSRRENPTP